MLDSRESNRAPYFNEKYCFSSNENEKSNSRLACYVAYTIFCLNKESSARLSCRLPNHCDT
jgi:hypothetical protein